MIWQRVCIFASAAILTCAWPESESCVEEDSSLLQAFVSQEGDKYGNQKTAVNCSYAQKIRFLYGVSCEKDIFESKAACEEHRAMTTYLASFPGSGNTWLRSTLEGLTGISTGSMYLDSALVAAGFKGENKTNPTIVLGVKTHFPGTGLHEVDAQAAAQAVILVRQPLDAILAECQRKVAKNISDNSHDKEVPLQILQPYVESQFSDMLKRWKLFIEWWKEEFTGRRIFVRYEDLNTAEVYSQQILPFLKVNTSHPDVLRPLACQLDGYSSKSGIHRHHSYTYKFTREQLEMARNAVGHLLPMFNYTLTLP